MMRRTNRWIAVGCTLLGLAGWQTFGGSASLACPAGDGGQVSREAEQQPQSDVVQADDGTGDATHTSKVRQAEHIRPSAGDPFAPITVDEILTASSERPVSSLPTSGEASPAGYLAPPVPIGETHGSLAATHPVPLAEAVMPGMSPMLGGPAGAMIPGGSMAVALDGGCGACGRTVGGPCGELYSGLINNMVVIAAFDYFTNTGDLQSERLRRAATQLNIGPVEIPDLDPQRIAGLFGANAGAPITRGGRICYQVGFNYNQAEQGAHGFFTTGIFHRAGPGDCWPINWGSVYDFMYDDFLGYHAGQVRLKMGYLFGECDEVGGWVAISTNTDEEEATIRTQTLDPQGNRVGPVFDDTIQSRVTVTQAAYLFWRHVFGDWGAEAEVFVGERENLDHEILVGGTGKLPLNDRWAVICGGHWSGDADDRGGFDVYTGVALYPGCNARANFCNSRYLPYMDAANNTFMNITIEPRLLIERQGNDAARL